MIQELQWETRGLSVDTWPVYQATIEDLDKDQISKFLKTRKQKMQEIDFDSALEYYQLITTEHNRVYPTMAGILLFGKNPQKFCPEAFIICSHFTRWVSIFVILIASLVKAINFISPPQLSHFNGSTS